VREKTAQHCETARTLECIGEPLENTLRTRRNLRKNSLGNYESPALTAEL